MTQLSFREKLEAYLQEAKTATVPFRAILFQEIGQGVILIYDNMDEYDSYFNPDEWEPVSPEIWGDSLFPLALRKHNIHCLPGVGRAPAIAGFEEARAFAKRQLKSRKGATWHEAPADPRKYQFSS